MSVDMSGKSTPSKSANHLHRDYKRKYKSLKRIAKQLVFVSCIHCSIFHFFSDAGNGFSTHS